MSTTTSHPGVRLARLRFITDPGGTVVGDVLMSRPAADEARSVAEYVNITTAQERRLSVPAHVRAMRREAGRRAQALPDAVAFELRQALEELAWWVEVRSEVRS